MIKTRRLTIPFEQTNSMRFFGDNLLTSAYFTSVSCVLPAFEKGIIQTVKEVESLISSETLKKELRELVRQEAQHSYQHRLMNKRITDLGFDAMGVEAEMFARFEHYIKDKSLVERLAIVVCFEHLSAVLSAVSLEHDDLISQCDEVILDMFMWHCMEELEHKSVLYEVYMDVCGDENLLKRTLLGATLFIFKSVNTNITELIKRTGLRVTFTEFWQHFRLYLGTNGIAWKAVKPFISFYQANFHPASVDSSTLINKWENDYRKIQYELAEISV